MTAPTHKGFGSWVIERGLAHELGGKVTLDYLPGGVACAIDIPAPAGGAMTGLLSGAGSSSSRTRCWC